MHKNKLFQKIMYNSRTTTLLKCQFKRKIYLSTLSLLLSILLLLLFFMNKNYRYNSSATKSLRDPFCRSNDRFQRFRENALICVSISTFSM